MKFPGTCWKEGKYWLIEVPALDLMTQGLTKKEAFTMIQDAIESLVVEELKLGIEVLPGKGNDFSVGCKQPKFLIALMLKRLRAANNLTIQEVANRLGFSSKNAYAQYEQAKNEPATSKLSQLLRAINPSMQVSVLL